MLVPQARVRTRYILLTREAFNRMNFCGKRLVT